MMTQTTSHVREDAAQRRVSEEDTLLINSNKDSKFAGDTQIEISIPEGTTIDGTPYLPTWGVSHLDYFIDHISDVYGCPRDYVTMSVMIAISTAIGTNATSFDGKYKNNPLLWGLLIGEQSTNKSEPLKQAFKPLYDIDFELHDNYLKRKSACAEGDVKPTYEHNIVGDSTPEYRSSLLGRHKHGICYLRDEMASKFAEVNRYNSGSEVETELTIFSAGQLCINRKGDEPILIKSPFMNQIGTIQPDIVSKYMGSDMFMYNGYLARWLFVFPDNKICSEYSDKTVENSIVNRYDKFIRYIHENSSLSAYTVTYSPDAKRMYADYYNLLQKKATQASDSYEAGIYGKLQIHVQRWALVTYVARVFELSEGTTITGDIMKYSIECMTYFEYTALKVRNLILNSRNTVTRNKGLTKENILQELVKSYPKAGENKQALADLIGVSRSQVSRSLNKDAMLRCYGYGSNETVSTSEKDANLSVTSINEAV